MSLLAYPPEWAVNNESKVAELPWYKFHSFKILIQYYMLVLRMQAVKEVYIPPNLLKSKISKRFVDTEKWYTDR